MFADSGAHLVSVLVISVDPPDSDAVAAQATALMQNKSTLPGFLEGEIFKSEDRERVLVITEWTSRQEWSASQWDQEVGTNIATISQTAMAVDSRTYFRIGRSIQPGGAKGEG